MKTVVLGDIHGNLEALEAVLAEVDTIGPDNIYSVGDVIGYGADSSACLSIMREREIPFLQGNWEWSLFSEEAPDQFNKYAAASVYWMRGALSKEEKEFIRTIPPGIKEHGFEVAHGIPGDFRRYMLKPEDAEQAFLTSDEDLIFIGHTHAPMAVYEARPLDYVTETEFTIPEGKRCLVNVGAVGQPRDGDSRAAFCLYDSEERKIEIRRVEYDLEKAASKIIEAGLPRILAERLAMGK